MELIFSDLETLERRIAKTTKSARMDKEAAKELELLKRLKELLEEGKPASVFEAENEDEELLLKGYNLLTNKRSFMRQMYQKMIWQMMRFLIHMSRKSVNMQKRLEVKYLLFVHRLNRKLRNWTMMKRKNFWKIWELRNQDWKS